MNSDNQNQTYTGTIEADEVKISCELGGIISEVFIKEGQRIKAGNRVANIDMTDLNIKLRKAENRLEFAKTKLNEILNGARNEEIKSARANVRKTKVQLEGFKKNYEYRLENFNNIKKLYNEGAVSNQQLDDSKSLLDSAETNLKSIEKQYESSLAALELLLNGATEYNIKANQLEVEKAEIEIDNLKNQINKCKIKAPIDGIIQTLNFNKGELIPTGGVISTVIDTDNLWVKIYISEKELFKIKLGEDVYILTDPNDKNTIKGKVVYISSEAEFTPKNVESKENKEEMVFEVKIKILEKDNSLKPGMFVDIKLKEVN
jgi:HlyD family secretion protein